MHSDSELTPNQLFPTGEDSLAIQLHWPSTDSSTIQENTVDTNTVESRVKEFYGKLIHALDDIQYKSEFNYVRDVLELSGFSGNEILGKWHSAEQPVDPSVFEEVEGCLIAQPDCSGNEEGGCSFYASNQVELNTFNDLRCIGLCYLNDKLLLTHKLLISLSAIVCLQAKNLLGTHRHYNSLVVSYDPYTINPHAS
ncbi:uncharacterized protein Fot_21094 [Forsythia ovata]|uniref:DUF4378 domain-containing protein n=1 Tax=Forsythia ovata TaxID=205694 RepID=A0ABD1UTU8_9LAMI